jgi:hypothetical protein
MKQLNERVIVDMFRDEWKSRVLRLENDIKTFLKIPGTDSEPKSILGVDTKVRHKGSQILYTVVEVGPNDIILSTPEGKNFCVDAKSFQKEYELD